MTVMNFIGTIQYDDDVEIEVRHDKYKYATSYYDDYVDGYMLKMEDAYERFHDVILNLDVKKVVVFRSSSLNPVTLFVEV